MGVTARVLVVDDERRNVQVADAMLRLAGHEVRTAASGEEALEVAREWRPDLILLDVMMPGIDGFEVCRRLRTDADIADTRVFLLTSLDDAESRLAGFEAGADSFITKPLNRRELLARVEAVARVNRYRGLLREHRGLGRVAPVVAPAPAADLVRAADHQDLDAAIASLFLVFQPILRLSQERGVEVLAHEALMRSRHEKLANPLAVLAAAERLGRVHEVSRAVRSLVARFLVANPGAGTLFVNVLSSDLGEQELLASVDPLRPHARRIVLEVTEREALGAAHDLRQAVQTLREQGFRFAVDDLGGGYSGLNNVAVIEPEYVKLDRQLVAGLHVSPIRQRIAHTIGALCRDLGIDMIAEGIEEVAESRLLAEFGCHLQQGYLFARPAEQLWSA